MVISWITSIYVNIVFPMWHNHENSLDIADSHHVNRLIYIQNIPFSPNIPSSEKVGSTNG